jgi:hypothetical protein
MFLAQSCRRSKNDESYVCSPTKVVEVEAQWRPRPDLHFSFSEHRKFAGTLTFTHLLSSSNLEPRSNCR